ncbi:hypothetical protein TNCV_4128161 [Trichonephila clavipes]|uniref:Uncharacterized protein n=1 Tax=Trichonephila clavipes TaxID=2585209 RepID=A0A8X6VMW2_TRICX|nr:hypothetical protein TNCV_4128161 [Trichonephila clavipes]
MVLKANDRRTSCPCPDEFRGPRSDYVRQVALATTVKWSLEKNHLLFLHLHRRQLSMEWMSSLEKETPNSISKKIAQGNLTASFKRLISWFLLHKGTELGHKIVPVRPPKF